MKLPSFGFRSFPLLRIALIAIAAAPLAMMCVSAPSTQAAVTPLSVRYPPQGTRLPYVVASFAFGAAAPGATVTVNGKRASIAPSGGWIAYVPLSPGRFVLHVRARLDTQNWAVDRAVLVDDGSVPAYPASITIVQPGDALLLSVNAAAGSSVSASGPGFSNVALRVVPGSRPAVFATSVLARRGAGLSHVRYHIIAQDGRRSDVTSRGTLEVASRPVLFVGDVIEHVRDRAVGARPYGMLGPIDGDTEFTVPLGTELELTGRSEDQFRVALPGGAPEWIDRHEVAVDRAAHAPLVARIRSTNRTENATQTALTIALTGARPPFRVYESPAGANGAIKIFGVENAPHRCAIVRFALRQHAFWGYRAQWSGDDLIVTFRKPPAFAASPAPALTGLRVAVDPGHSPDTGAIGPLGTLERDVNLDISRRLSARLQALGAAVVMTRDSGAPVALYDRPAIAERAAADVLISIHNNAWPDGVDPATSHGYSVYYFQPHSRALAEAIHDSYARSGGLPDEGLHRGDFALVRSSALPSVLTESAFITWPWEEMKLRDPAFRERLAATIATGMERWAERMRSNERGSD